MTETSTYDAIVIGGGLTGVATAFQLARGGASVLLVEQHQLNRGASGRNAGSLHFQLEHRLIEFEGVLDNELAHYAALARLAIADWRGLEAELGQPLEVAMHGGLMLAETAAELRTLERKAAIERAQGLDVELLGRADVLARVPYLGATIAGALYCPDEGHCNPRLLTHGYARAAEALGAIVKTRAAVTGMRRTRGRWLVSLHSAEEGELTTAAEVVVNAAGAWAARVAAMAGVELPVYPVALIISVTEKAPVLLQHLVQHVGRKLSLKQVDDGNLLIGGGWLARLPPQQDHLRLDYRAALDLGELQNNLATASSVMPLIGGLHVLRSWTGTTALTPDQLPIIGASAGAPGLFTAVGGSGFTYGPTYARLLSELVLRQEASFPLAPYSPDRFTSDRRALG
jgi:glycine/D-amino acid oxidase-like deaminating enzyme